MHFYNQAHRTIRPQKKNKTKQKKKKQNKTKQKQKKRYKLLQITDSGRLETNAHHQCHGFGDVLRKFDTNLTFAMDFVYIFFQTLV